MRPMIFYRGAGQRLGADALSLFRDGKTGTCRSPVALRDRAAMACPTDESVGRGDCRGDRPGVRSQRIAVQAQRPVLVSVIGVRTGDGLALLGDYHFGDE